VQLVELKIAEYEPGKQALHLLPWLEIFVKKPALQVHSCGDETPVPAVVEKAGQPWHAVTVVAPAPVK
jgi:hypothetical protein